MVRLHSKSFVVCALACSVAAVAEASTCAANGGQGCQTIGTQLLQKNAHKSEINASFEEVDDEEKQLATGVEPLRVVAAVQVSAEGKRYGYPQLVYPDTYCKSLSEAECKTVPGFEFHSVLNSDDNWIDGCFEWYSTPGGQNEHTKTLYYNKRAGATTGNVGGNRMCSQAPQMLSSDWPRITCPVIGALFKAGDLMPNAAGVVTKAQTRAAMLRAGISEDKTTETTNGNFDHLPGDKEINLFNMDLQMAFDKPLDLRNKEHDFSTGVRDGAEPSETAYKVFEQFIGANDRWSQKDVAVAIEYYEKERNSNDVGKGIGGIKSLGVMLAEFADADRTLSKIEMRGLFMSSEYPAEFAQRRNAAVKKWEESLR